MHTYNMIYNVHKEPDDKLINALKCLPGKTEQMSQDGTIYNQPSIYIEDIIILIIILKVRKLRNSVY